MFRRGMIALLVVLVGGVLIGPASAGSTTMAALLAGETIVSGDKEFFDWGVELAYVVAGDPAGAPAPEDLVVQWQDDPSDPLNIGITYVGGFELISEEGTGGKRTDIAWDYKVRTVSGAPLIKDASAQLIAFDVTGQGKISLIETIRDTDIAGPVIDTFTVRDDIPEGEVDWADTYGPVSQVHVVKNLLLATGEEAEQEDSVHLSVFGQKFSQVPEASSFALFGLGVIGLGLFRRFQKR